MVVINRGLGCLNCPSTSKVKPYTEYQAKIQQIMAVCSSSVSILLAVVTIYCLSKIRRTFRHTYVQFCVATLPLEFILIGCQAHPAPDSISTAQGFLVLALCYC